MAKLPPTLHKTVNDYVPVLAHIMRVGLVYMCATIRLHVFCLWVGDCWPKTLLPLPGLELEYDQLTYNRPVSPSKELSSCSYVGLGANTWSNYGMPIHVVPTVSWMAMHNVKLMNDVTTGSGHKRQAAVTCVSACSGVHLGTFTFIGSMFFLLLAPSGFGRMVPVTINYT